MIVKALQQLRTMIAVDVRVVWWYEDVVLLRSDFDNVRNLA
jgi:hypothetical protein